MKKVLLIILLCAGIFAQVKQTSINTLADYNKFVTDMKKLIKLGDYNAAIPLAALYMQKLKLKDGIKQEDIKKAKKYLYLAYNNGYGFAAFYLSMLEDPEQAIILLKRAIHMKHNTKKIKQLIAIRYSELILNSFLYKNKEAVKVAIKDLSPIVYNSNNPILDFEFAHLLYIDKDIKLANKFLNSACNNPRANKKLLAMCINDPYVQSRDKNGNLIRKTDVIKDTTTPFNSACMQKYSYQQ